MDGTYIWKLLYVFLVENVDRDRIDDLLAKIDKENEIFADKSKLDPLIPETEQIVGRDTEMAELVRHLAGYKKGYVPPLISVYGRSGAGKSTLVRFVLDKMLDISYCFVNIRKAKTVFGAANIILEHMNQNQLKSAQGLNLAMDAIRKGIISIMSEKKSLLFVLVLDEFDAIRNDKNSNPSDFVYKIVEIIGDLRKERRLVCMIAISNNVLADYELDDRVKSRTGISEVMFTPYKKEEIYKILHSRAEKAFKKRINDAVIVKCAEIGVLEHGDARRAIDLLRVSAEIAGTSGAALSVKHVDIASETLQVDRMVESIKALSWHGQIACLAVAMRAYGLEQDWHTTNDLYKKYKQILNENPLSYRRFSDLLRELENSGIVESKKTSKGRGGYNAEFMLAADPDTVGRIIDSKWWEENPVKMKNNQKNIESQKLGKKDDLYDLRKESLQKINDYWR
jgi:archaeal cell division control protein 6